MIFDNDGVLSNTLIDSYKADCKVFEEAKVRVPTLNEYRTALRTTNWDDFYFNFGIDDVNSAVKFYYSVLPDNPSVIPGVIEALESLKHPRALVSKFSDKDKLLLRLDKAGLLKFFDYEHIHAVEKSKIEAIKKEIDSNYTTFYVGDTVDDIIDAKEAGVLSVAISAKTSFCSHEDLVAEKPFMIIPHIEELVKYDCY